MRKNKKSELNSDHLNPKITVDVVVFAIDPVEGQLKVLLVNRKNKPFQGSFALPGGFLLSGETSKDTVDRVLKEKAGVSALYAEQLYTFDTPDRDPRGPVFSITYIALVDADKLKLEESKDTHQPELFDIKKLPELAFDHKDIISYSIKRLQGKVDYTNMSALALPKLFTLTDLQKVYEIVLGREIDKRNFRKKILQLGFIEETDKMQTGQRRRPAKLYKSKSNKLIEIDRFI